MGVSVGTPPSKIVHNKIIDVSETAEAIPAACAPLWPSISPFGSEFRPYAQKKGSELILMSTVDEYLGWKNEIFCQVVFVNISCLCMSLCNITSRCPTGPPPALVATDLKIAGGSLPPLRPPENFGPHLWRPRTHPPPPPGGRKLLILGGWSGGPTSTSPWVFKRSLDAAAGPPRR